MYGTPQPASSPTNQTQFTYPNAAPQSPYTYPSLPQYASPPPAYSGVSNGSYSRATPGTNVAPTVTTYVTSYGNGSTHNGYPGHAPTASSRVPPSYGIAMAYSSHKNASSVSASGAQSAGYNPYLQASYQAPVPVTKPQPSQRAGTAVNAPLYPGIVYVAPTPPELSGKQQYLHKGANEVPMVYYNPYTTANPYTHNLRVSGAQPSSQAPSAASLNSSYQANYPQFGGNAKVQVGASHLAASRAQDDYMRQIKALQSFYGYSSTASQDAEYAVPVPKSQVRHAPEHQGERIASLTQSVDSLLSSGSKDLFLQEQERILRECNAKKVEIEAHKKTNESNLLIEDESELFEELLRSENPNADVSYPVLVVPEPLDKLDEKLEKRIFDAQAFSRRARAFSRLDTTLWNLVYTLKELSPTLVPTGPKKELVRHSYLVSSKGRREPLEESLSRDWQLLEDSDLLHGPSHANNGMNDLFGNTGFLPTGRFQYPDNMVTFDNPMAFSARPAQIAKGSEIEKSLYCDNVDLHQLRSFCLGYGIPKRVRAFVWQLLLSYIPPKAFERGKTLLAKRIEYFDYFDKYLSEKVVLTKQDRTMFNLVLVDAPRTHPDGYHALFNKPCVQASLERILYLWARNHPETSYYQGLNDLASIVLVVFLECCLPDLADLGTPAGQEDLMDHLGLPSVESSFLASPQCTEALESALFCIEADAYHCLTLILERVKEFHFFSAGGVYSESMIVHFEELVKRADPELHAHLISNELMFIQFSFRWMLCFFTRELETRNLVCLWDSYIVEQLGFPLFHIYVCTAYLIELRKQLLGSDMITMMGFLQRAPTGHFTKHDIHRLVQNAAELAMRFPLNIQPIKKP